MIKKSEELKLGDAPMDHPSIFQEDSSAYFKKTQASNLGDVQGIPFFINNLSDHF